MEDSSLLHESDESEHGMHIPKTPTSLVRAHRRLQLIIRILTPLVYHRKIGWWASGLQYIDKRILKNYALD